MKMVNSEADVDKLFDSYLQEMAKLILKLKKDIKSALETSKDEHDKMVLQIEE
jgi:hypothetical protein